MASREFNNQTTNFILDNTTENFLRYNVNPQSNLSFDFGTRNGKVIIHNISSQYMLGDIKPNEIAEFTKKNGTITKTILQQGTKYQIITFTNPANNAVQVLTKYDGNSDIIWVNDASTNGTHQTELIPPTKMGQVLEIYHNGGQGRVNFGITTRCVEGVFYYQSTTTGHSGTASSKRADIRSTAITGNNKYVILINKGYMKFRAMKNPVDGTLFWIVEDGTSQKILPE